MEESVNEPVEGKENNAKKKNCKEVPFFHLFMQLRITIYAFGN